MRTFRKDGQTMVVADVAATLFLREGWTEVEEGSGAEVSEDAPVAETTSEAPVKRRRRRPN